MKHTLGFVSVLVLLAPVTASPALGGPNILENPGFETGELAPWFQDEDFGGAEDWNVTTADAHSGIYSATDVGNKSIRQNFDAVATEMITEVSFWLRQPTVGKISFVTFFYSDGTDGGDLVFLSSGEWEFFDVTSFLEPGKMLTGWGLFGYSGGGKDEDRTYLDDALIQIQESPCPWDCQTSAGGPDGNVGINDLLDLLGQWNEIGGSCDLGVGAPGAGIEDLLKILGNWGPCP